MSEMIQQGSKDRLNYYVCKDRKNMGKVSANLAIDEIKKILNKKEEVRIVFAAAPSQNEVLYYLTESKEIDWSKIVGFHMDEYLNLPLDSDQWFKNYLQKHVANKVNMKAFHFMNGMADPEEEIKRYTHLLLEKPIDLVCLGIGENGHIAFNDPHVADFEDPDPIKVIALDQASRNQQVNDGAFKTISEVPTHAMTLTIPPLISAGCLVCTVPGETKKEAVSKVFNQPIDTSCPATILRKHDNAHLILDSESFGG
ncbi:6-phosphogluconolactonase [Oceanobacillus jeddahense]|uniref:6-phosphogluconolactonase n=1 Tax=Oceanobacillus jeddahense TaxID=1462527 RepID=UPI0005960450|nr:6-phosphogluconolactonase [Oceanobacillus jeddahense]